MNMFKIGLDVIENKILLLASVVQCKNVVR